MKKTLNDYFDAIYCINLDRRPDRKKQAQEEFDRHGIKVEFISGIDGLTMDIPIIKSADDHIDSRPVSRGDVGCTMSHHKVAVIAKELGLKNCLVFEDDVVLADNINDLFDDYFKEVPKDWDMLYFGGNHQGGVYLVSDHVAKIFHTYTTHAYAITDCIYVDLIRVLEKGDDKVDVSIASLHEVYNCYVFNPHLAYQREGFSDILERDVNYDHLKHFDQKK